MAWARTRHEANRVECECLISMCDPRYASGPTAAPAPLPPPVLATAAEARLASGVGATVSGGLYPKGVRRARCTPLSDSNTLLSSNSPSGATASSNSSIISSSSSSPRSPPSFALAQSLSSRANSENRAAIASPDIDCSSLRSVDNFAIASAFGRCLICAPAGSRHDASRADSACLIKICIARYGPGNSGPLPATAGVCNSGKT